jgi:sterol desaturase/sphingolipid hydroxylase (fatty acid hydroxylase superfamily)
MMLASAIEFVVAAAGALLVGTLAEYFVHRLMHWGILYSEGHRRHHENNEARNYLRDFVDYGSGAALLCWPGFLVSLAAGSGWFLGALAYAVLASYSHQLQHANADLVFWMRRPVHRTHHNHDMKGHNFGILVDWWDRLFGTYQPIEWPRTQPGGHRAKDYLAIPWR